MCMCDEYKNKVPGEAHRHGLQQATVYLTTQIIHFMYTAVYSAIYRYGQARGLNSRKVLIPDESPWNLISIRNMEIITLAGGTILPPVPAFYHQPKTTEDLLRHTAGKILDLFGLEHDLFARWAGGDRDAAQ